MSEWQPIFPSLCSVKSTDDQYAPDVSLGANWSSRANRIEVRLWEMCFYHMCLFHTDITALLKTEHQPLSTNTAGAHHLVILIWSITCMTKAVFQTSSSLKITSRQTNQPRPQREASFNVISKTAANHKHSWLMRNFYKRAIYNVCVWMNDYVFTHFAC